MVLEKQIRLEKSMAGKGIESIMRARHGADTISDNPKTSSDIRKLIACRTHLKCYEDMIPLVEDKKAYIEGISEAYESIDSKIIGYIRYSSSVAGIKEDALKLVIYAAAFRYIAGMKRSSMERYACISRMDYVSGIIRRIKTVRETHRREHPDGDGSCLPKRFAGMLLEIIRKKLYSDMKDISSMEESMIRRYNVDSMDDERRMSYEEELIAYAACRRRITETIMEAGTC